MDERTGEVNKEVKELPFEMEDELAEELGVTAEHFIPPPLVDPQTFDSLTPAEKRVLAQFDAKYYEKTRDLMLPIIPESDEELQLLLNLKTITDAKKVREFITMCEKFFAMSIIKDKFGSNHEARRIEIGKFERTQEQKDAGIPLSADELFFRKAYNDVNQLRGNYITELPPKFSTLGLPFRISGNMEMYTSLTKKAQGLYWLTLGDGRGYSAMPDGVKLGVARIFMDNMGKTMQKMFPVEYMKNPSNVRTIKVT